jgi:ATP-dependent Clp protease ATP-binding subunit ClpC
MFDKFSDNAKKVLTLSREEAGRLGHDYIGTEHILLGLILSGASVGNVVLENLGVDLVSMRLEVEKFINASGATSSMTEVPFTPKAKHVLELAVDEAQVLGNNYIGSEHFLLGLIREEEGVCAFRSIRPPVPMQSGHYPPNKISTIKI